MKRREFLVGSAMTFAAGKVWAQSPGRGKLDRIAVMTQAFSEVLKSPAHAGDPRELST